MTNLGRLLIGVDGNVLARTMSDDATINSCKQFCQLNIITIDVFSIGTRQVSVGTYPTLTFIGVTGWLIDIQVSLSMPFVQLPEHVNYLQPASYHHRWHNYYLLNYWSHLKNNRCVDDTSFEFRKHWLLRRMLSFMWTY